MKSTKALREIKVMYHDEEMPDLGHIGGLGHSCAIDLYTAEDIWIEAGESAIISLGVSIKIPDGHKADVRPRSSTFKKFGIIQTNSKGLIDTTYCGPGDIWKMPVHAPVIQEDIYDMMAQCFFKIANGDIKTTFRNEKECREWLQENTSPRVIHIPKYTRLCQMEIMPQMEPMTITKADLSSEKNRGGFGEGTDHLK